MGIWERLGNVIKSYVNDGVEWVLGEEKPKFSHKDEDFDAAYDELNDFLKGDKAERPEKEREKPKDGENFHRYYESFVPSELKPDFIELGLTPGASEEECKEAYKKLLKIHHPDRHGGDPELMKKATEKSARINASYDRLQAWFKKSKG